MSRLVCIKCLLQIEKDEKFSRLTPVGFEKFKDCCKEWSKIDMHKVLDERITNVCFQQGMVCHKNCYSVIVNKLLIKKAADSFNQKHGVRSQQDTCLFCQYH